MEKSVVDGRQLKAARIILGLTVREMADAAGLNRNSVLNVEAHKTLPHSAWAADRIAKTLEGRGILFTLDDCRAGIQFEATTKRGRVPYIKNIPQA